ncbi:MULTISPECIES: PH domain-containing protein [Prauserella salsuginis group]|uniref:PH domain-containing protein n=1 Tax=Prauserella salsuginis TaxID=387889 RepID=A0ABW6G3B6_9PSEU|nr:MULTISPECIES: PH domain-containing protein [Prauserella salsuginis group]MCR3718573.1 putative membrane protein [Prauserella flava]MCR3733143.1 putative membrane protein [Prauserella salsuginis]
MTTPDGELDGEGTVEPDAGWRRLDPRTVRVSLLTVAGICVAAGVPTGLGIASSSLFWALVTVLPASAAALAGTVVVEGVRLRRTRYRVLADRVELTKGVAVLTRRSVSRDRIRTVDLTAGPPSRFLGIVTVKIDTGEQGGSSASSVTLFAVSREEGERLRAELLDRGRPDSAGTADGRIATFDPRWARYGPLSVLTPALGAAAYGGVLQVAEWFGLRRGVITGAIDLLGGFGLVGGIAMVVAVGLVIGVLGSLAVLVEMWWNFRLDREPGGTLRVRRGLLTARSISIEEQRLRGVELVEPLGVRLAGGARVDAVATGLRSQSDEDKGARKTLLPAAPHGEASRVAAAVLRETAGPASTVLTRHPVAARGRRIRWALAAAAAPVAVAAACGWVFSSALFGQLAWIGAVVGVPIALALAVDAYRNLGHGLSGDYLVARRGSVRRSTVALQRRGVIGLTARQSLFQRRRGLLTITATTAAGSGAYSVPDVDASEGLAFADDAVPGLFGPLLERV